MLFPPKSQRGLFVFGRCLLVYVCCFVCVQLRQEKVDLENQLEREQEYVVNKLRKQLAQACTDFIFFVLF